jgi:hypothetical protein
MDWNKLLYALIGVVLAGIGYVIRGIVDYFVEKRKTDLRIKEIFIKNAVEALQELQKWLYEIHNGVLACQESPSNETYKNNLCRSMEDFKKNFYFRNSVYLRKLRARIEEFIQVIYRKKDTYPNLIISDEYFDAFHKNINGLQKELDKIAQKYNPLL